MRGQPIHHFRDDKARVQRHADREGRIVVRRRVRVPAMRVIVIPGHGCYNSKNSSRQPREGNPFLFCFAWIHSFNRTDRRVREKNWTFLRPSPVNSTP